MPSPTQGATSLAGTFDAVELGPSQNPVELEPAYGPIRRAVVTDAAASEATLPPLEEDSLPMTISPSISTFSPFQTSAGPTGGRTHADSASP